MNLLLALALWAHQDDPRRVLETLEKTLLEATSVKVKFIYEAPPSVARQGTIQLGDGNRGRITFDYKAGDEGAWMICDGKRVANLSKWTYSSGEAPEDFGARVRTVIARAGAVWIPFPTNITEQKEYVYLTQDARSDLEVSDLKTGKEEGGRKSIAYTLRSPSLKPRGDLRIQLWYDPATYRLMRREMTIGANTMRESYSEWSFRDDIPEEVFTLPPPPRFGAQLRGKISVKGTFRESGMTVGCLGVDRVHSPWGVGSDSLSQLPPLDIKKLSWNPKTGMVYGFKDVPAGKQLTYMHWGEHYFDWRWIEIKDDPRATVPQVDLTLEPASAGSVEVRLTDPTVREVMFVLADDEGKVPKWSPRLVGRALTERVKNGKTTFQGLRPGKYVFYAPETEYSDAEAAESRDPDGKLRYRYVAPASVDTFGNPPRVFCPAEVRAKQVTRIELK